MKYLLAFCILFIPTVSIGQDFDFSDESDSTESIVDSLSTKPKKPRSKFIENMYLGGSFGLLFGTTILIDISPLIGYRIYKGFSAGLGFTYQYVGGRYTAHTFGGRIFARYNIWKGIMAHAEFELLNLNCLIKNKTELSSKREWLPGVLLGGGYNFKVGKRVGIQALILVNILESDCRPSSNPIFRLGASFGL